MLKRYSGKQMEEIWSEENKFRSWLCIEIAVLKVRHKLGELPFDVPDYLFGIPIDTEEINRIEKEITKHDVVAFLMHVSPDFPEELRPWLHRGLTSYDIGDTALSLQMRESLKLIIIKISALMQAVKKKAIEHKFTPMIGRTHGIHAEPITFGIKLANWYDELNRGRRRIQHLLDAVSVGKLSGAVGMYTVDPKVEEEVCLYLGLKPIIATQIISRDIVAEYLSTLAITCASIGKIAINLRLLSQTEIGEIMESFSKDQKGSSAMPHKKNPIGSENLSGLMRVAYSNAQVAFENLASCWHERSLDNSGSERVVIADTSILLDYALTRLLGIIENMSIFPGRMLRNLRLSKGLVFSQEVMMLVAEKSKLPREKAHTLVRDIALECWENGSDFLLSLVNDRRIMSYVDIKDLRKCFEIENKIRYTDFIFKKVFRDE